MRVEVLHNPDYREWLGVKRRALVNMILDINAESLMTLMNKRLCGCATKEMQKLMMIIKKEVIWTNPEFKEFLVPMCLYLKGCNEFNSCGGNCLFMENLKNEL